MTLMMRSQTLILWFLIGFLNGRRSYMKTSRMAKMWQSMNLHHENQQKAIRRLRNLDKPHDLCETSDRKVRRSTVQLLHMILEWNSRLRELMDHQKVFINTLDRWSKLSLLTTASFSKENMSPMTRPTESPMNALLRLWQDELESLPLEMAGNAIHGFSEVIDRILQYQKEKRKQKEKLQKTNKQYKRMERSLENRRRSYKRRRAITSDEKANTDQFMDNPIAERKKALDYLRSKLKDEEERYHNLCRQAREISFESLRRNLPELFQHMSDFALKCSEMYKKLLSMA